MKKTILEQIYETLLSRKIPENDFIENTRKSNELYEKLLNCYPKELQYKINDHIDDYGYEKFCCGFVNGFRTALQLQQELNNFTSPYFLSGILEDRSDERF